MKRVRSRCDRDRSPFNTRVETKTQLDGEFFSDPVYSTTDHIQIYEWEVTKLKKEKARIESANVHLRLANTRLQRANARLEYTNNVYLQRLGVSRLSLDRFKVPYFMPRPIAEATLLRYPMKFC
jgi:FtsZ-binding cell division protein ZapB